MKAIELTGDIDDRHRLRAEVPKELPAGPVRLTESNRGASEIMRLPNAFFTSRQS
jgi:hypothetical protein